MSISRKCPDCQQWTNDSDICAHCHRPLNMDEVRRIEENEQLKRGRELNTGRMDAWIDSLKKSTVPGSRLLYYIVSSVWIVVLLLLSFIYALIAFIAG